MSLPHKPKPSPAEGEFLFELDPEPLEECLTAYAGIPLFVRAIRSFNVPGSVKQHVHLKQRQRGLDEASYVESFLVLNALGGECLDDFARLREDAGLRFAVMAHNVLSGLKRIAMKPDWLRARPKRLRFQVFFSPGKLVHHARQILLKVGRLREQVREWTEGLRLLPATG